jgi:hypothetical protein
MNTGDLGVVNTTVVQKGTWVGILVALKGILGDTSADTWVDLSFTMASTSGSIMASTSVVGEAGDGVVTIGGGMDTVLSLVPMGALTLPSLTRAWYGVRNMVLG